MNKLATKIGVGLIGGAVATLLAIGPAFAAPRLRCVIKNNGRNSHNKCELKLERKVEVDVDNDADVENKIDLWLSTGGNEVKDNQGNKNSIKTGKIDITITIENRVNQGQPPVL